MHDWERRLRAALATADHPPTDDIVEELAQHARATYEAARADGYPAEEAEARVADLVNRWQADSGSLKHRSHAVDAVVPHLHLRYRDWRV